MSPAQPPPEDLLDLIEGLRRNGFNVGTQQFIAAQKLLVKLAADGGWLERPERLGTLFAPIDCTTPGEQENFPRYCGRWLGTRPALFKAHKSSPDVTPVKEPPAKPSPSVSRSVRGASGGSCC